MKNRHWLTVVEYASLVGSGVGSAIAIASQQVVYASAPLTFCLLLNLINRNRQLREAEQKILPQLDKLDHQAAKDAKSTYALRRHVMTLPAPEVLESIRKEMIQADRETIAIVQSRLQERLAPLDAIEPLRVDVAVLQAQNDQWQSFAAQTTQQLAAVAPSQRVERLEETIAQLTTEIQTHAQLVEDNRQSAAELAPLQTRLGQVEQQVSRIPHPFDPHPLEQQLKTLSQDVETLNQAASNWVPRHDLTSLHAELERVSQQHHNQSPAPLKQAIVQLKQRVDTLSNQFNARTEPQLIQRLRNSLVKLSETVTAAQQRLSELPTTATLTELHTELQEAVQMQTGHWQRQITMVRRSMGEVDAKVRELGDRSPNVWELEQQLAAVQHLIQTLENQQKALRQRVLEQQSVLDQLPTQVTTLATQLTTMESQYPEQSRSQEVPASSVRAIDSTPAPSAKVPSLKEHRQSHAIQLSHRAPLVTEQTNGQVFLERALDNVQERLIIAGPWSNQGSLDEQLVQKLRGLLSRNVRIDLDWSPHLGGGSLPSRRIQQQGDRGYPENLASANALKQLEQLKNEYPLQFRLKALGLRKQFLVCDRTFAVGRSVNPDAFAEATIDLCTTDPHIIQGLIDCFDQPELDSEERLSYAQRALARYDLGDLQGALADYTQALHIHPPDDATYNNRGLTHYDLGDRQKAAGDFEQALRINPDNAVAYFNRGIVRSDWGDKMGAIADYTATIELHPQDNVAYNNRGLSRSKLGDKQGAIGDYTCALQINPEDTIAYFNRGAVRSSLGDYVGAIDDYTCAIHLDPNFASAYNNRGFTRQRLADCAAAMRDFNRALQINPNFASAYNNRGTVRSKLGDFQGAIQDFSRALQINPDFTNARNNRGTARSKLKDLRGAITDFNHALQINPNFANAHNNRGLAKAELGEMRGATEDLVNAARLFSLQGDEISSQLALETLKKLPS